MGRCFPLLVRDGKMVDKHILSCYYLAKECNIQDMQCSGCAVGLHCKKKDIVSASDRKCFTVLHSSI